MLLALLAALSVSQATTDFGFTPRAAFRLPASHGATDARAAGMAGGAFSVELPLNLSIGAGAVRDRFVWDQGSIGVVGAAAMLRSSIPVGAFWLRAQLSV